MNMRRSRLPRIRLVSGRMPAWIAGCVVAMNLVLLAYTGIALDRSRASAEAQAELWTQNLSLALEKELAGIVNVADLALRSTIDEYERQRDAGGVDAARLDAFIARLKSRLPFVDGIRVTDAAGVLRYGTDVDPLREVNVADRGHFVALRGPGADRLVVSGLQRSRANGRWVIVFARRVLGADGRFNGIAFVPIAVDDLTATFARIAIPERGSVTLRGLDLGVIARHPPPRHGAPVPLGQADVGPELGGLIASGAAEGTVRAVAPIDGVLRVRSFRRVDGVPLYLVVGRAAHEYLEGWRQERIRALVTLSAFALLSGFAAWLLFGYWRRLESLIRTKDRMAQTDFLTGLANRRAFIAAVEREISRARRYASTFSVLLVDIDHFKSVNDTHGHAVGDATLRGIAKCARQALREVDLMARWGGEEFAVLLPDTDASNAAEAGERLRTLVAATPLGGHSLPIRVTISIGHATLGSDGESVDALMLRADRALYRAKEAGRDRVCG